MASTPMAVMRADLRLAGEEVEDRRALEAVAPVEVEDAVRARALAVRRCSAMRATPPMFATTSGGRRGRALPSTCVISSSYGKRREWMSDVWMQRDARLALLALRAGPLDGGAAVAGAPGHGGGCGGRCGAEREHRGGGPYELRERLGARHDGAQHGARRLGAKRRRRHARPVRRG